MTSIKDRIAKFNQPVSTSDNATLDKSGQSSTNQRISSVQSTTGTSNNSRVEKNAIPLPSSVSVVQTFPGSNKGGGALIKSSEEVKTANSSNKVQVPPAPGGSSRVAHLSKSFEASKSTTTTRTTEFSAQSSIGSKVSHLSKSFQNETVEGATSNGSSKVSSVQSSSPSNSKVSHLSKSFESAKISTGISKTPERSPSVDNKVNIFAKSLGKIKAANIVGNEYSAHDSPVNSEISRLSKSFESAKVVLALNEHSLTLDDISLVEQTIEAIAATVLEESSDKSGKQLRVSSSNNVVHLSKTFEPGKGSSPAIVGKSLVPSALSLKSSTEVASASRLWPNAERTEANQPNAVSKLLPENMTSLETRKRALSLNLPSVVQKEEAKSDHKMSSKDLSREAQGKRTFPEIQNEKPQPFPAPILKKMDKQPTAKGSPGRMISFCGQKRMILAGARAGSLRQLVDVQAIDAVATAKTPADARTSPYELVQYLTGLVNSLPCMEGANELMRQFAMLRVLQRWVGHNIAYDAKSLQQGTITSKKCEPAYVLQTGLAVCSGYSRLLCELAQLACLDMRCVSGASKGGGYIVGDLCSCTKADHEWNIVTLGSEAYHLDATWSAGTCQGLKFTREWNEHYFLTPAELFVLDHFPEDAGDQYISPAFTLEDFINLPHFQPSFFLAGMVPSTPWTFNGVIQCDGQPEVELKFNISEYWKVHQPELGTKSHAGMSKKFPDHATVFWESKNQIKVLCRVPKEKGEYILRLYTRQRDSDEFYSSAADYLIRVNHAPIEKPCAFPKIYSTDQIKILEPLRANLSVDTAVRFRHQLVGSGKKHDHQIVVILPGNNWVYLKSKRESDGSVLFEDVLYMEKRGEVSLSIQYSGEKSAHTIARYCVI